MGASPKLLSQFYPITPSTISNIVAKRIWKHL
jgi:hypothetical protein